MIRVTRLNGEGFVLNADCIREIEATPDTMVTLTTGQKIVVTESVEEIIRAVVEYKRALFTGADLPWEKND